MRVHSICFLSERHVVSNVAQWKLIDKNIINRYVGKVVFKFVQYYYDYACLQSAYLRLMHQ